jgi:hypothetical protein
MYSTVDRYFTGVVIVTINIFMCNYTQILILHTILLSRFQNVLKVDKKATLAGI